MVLLKPRQQACTPHSAACCAVMHYAVQVITLGDRSGVQITPTSLSTPTLYLSGSTGLPQEGSLPVPQLSLTPLVPPKWTQHPHSQPLEPSRATHQSPQEASPAPKGEDTHIAVATPVQPVPGPGPAAEGQALCPPELQQAVIASGVHALSHALGQDAHMQSMLAQFLASVTQGCYESPGLRLDSSGTGTGANSLICA